MICANRLSVYGAIADLRNELSKDLKASEKPAAPDHSETMEIPIWSLCWRNSDPNAQHLRNLSQECVRKFAQLSEDQKLSKLCSDAGFKLVERGPYFYSLETEEGQQMQHVCREYTMPRNEKETRIRGWILKNTRIGPVLNMKVCRHEDRNSIEVLLQSLFQDRTTSWVRLVSGVDKYVTESMLSKEEEDMASVKPIAKTRPRQKLTVTLTSVSIPVLARKWIDIETQRSHDHKCYEVSKSHDSIATTWSISSSKKRRSNPPQEEEVRGCFAVVTRRLDINSGKRRRSEEKISILRESKLFQSIPVIAGMEGVLFDSFAETTYAAQVFIASSDALENSWKARRYPVSSLWNCGGHLGSRSLYCDLPSAWWIWRRGVSIEKYSHYLHSACDSCGRGVVVDIYACQTRKFNFYMHASSTFFVRQVGCLATCWMRSLESYPAHRPENVVGAAGVHPAAVLHVNSCILRSSCFAVTPWKNAWRSSDR